MLCSKCGGQVLENVKFCTGCGSQIERNESRIDRSSVRKKIAIAMGFVCLAAVVLLQINFGDTPGDAGGIASRTDERQEVRATEPPYGVTQYAEQLPAEPLPVPATEVEVPAPPAVTEPFPGIIAIVTRPFDFDEEEYRSAQALVERFGEDRVIHKTWWVGFSGDSMVVQRLLDIAENPDVNAIIINQATANTNWGIDAVRQIRGDDIFIAVGSAAEHPADVSMRVDLALDLNMAAVGEHFVAQALAMGAETIVHYSFPRHMAVPLLATRRDDIQRAAEAAGIAFHDLDSPDPMEVGMPASQLFIAEDVPRRVEEFGVNTVFLSTNCGQQIPLINGVIETGAMYMLLCCPSPFNRFPVALGLAESLSEAHDSFAPAEIVEATRQIIAEAGMTGRLANGAICHRMAWTYVGFMYAVEWLNGNAPRGEYPCIDLINRLVGDFAYSWHGERMYMDLTHLEIQGTVYPMFITGLPPFILY